MLCCFKFQKIFFLLCSEGIVVSLYVLGAFLLAGTLANLHAWAKAFRSLIFSQGKHLKRAVRVNESAPLTSLGVEVALMADMVKVIKNSLMFAISFINFNTYSVWMPLLDSRVD